MTKPMTDERLKKIRLWHRTKPCGDLWEEMGECIDEIDRLREDSRIAREKIDYLKGRNSALREENERHELAYKSLLEHHEAQTKDYELLRKVVTASQKVLVSFSTGFAVGDVIGSRNVVALKILREALRELDEEKS